MTRKKIAKSSKYFQLGEKGRNEIIEMRSKGKTYSQILKYLNKEYQNMLEKGEDFKLTGLFFFFKNWGNEIVEKAQNKRKQQIIEKLSDSKKIEDIIDLISGWIDEYAADGKKLSLKDSISFFLKGNEILLKTRIDTTKDNEEEKVKAFLEKISSDFNTPSITKKVELEFDKEGNVKKQIATETTVKRKEEEEDEEEEEELEEAIME